MHAVVNKTSLNTTPDTPHTPFSHISSAHTASSMAVIKPKSMKDDFMRGVKRDISLHSSFKDEKFWDSWNRCLHTLARTQGVSHVLDAPYMPTTPDETDLFQCQQEFMYSVFERTLLISQGKAFVRAHEHDFDAQTLYQELVTYFKSSTRGRQAASSILSYITTSRLGDGLWKGSTQDFLLHWTDKIHEYESLVPCAMLQNGLQLTK